MQVLMWVWFVNKQNNTVKLICLKSKFIHSFSNLMSKDIIFCSLSFYLCMFGMLISRIYFGRSQVDNWSVTGLVQCSHQSRDVSSHFKFWQQLNFSGVAFSLLAVFCVVVCGGCMHLQNKCLFTFGFFWPMWFTDKAWTIDMQRHCSLE